MQLFAILAMLFFTGPSGFGPGKVARMFSESFQKVFKKFTESFQKVARILPESCQKVSRKLPESCQTVMRQSWDSLLLYFSCSLYGHVCSCLFNEWISEWVSDPPIEWPHDHGLPFRQRPWKKIYIILKKKGLPLSLIMLMFLCRNLLLVWMSVFQCQTLAKDGIMAGALIPIWPPPHPPREICSFFQVWTKLVINF